MTQKELNAMVEIGQVPSSADALGRRAPGFDRLVEEYRALSEMIRLNEQEKKELSEKLMSYFADSEAKTVMSGGLRVTLAQNPGRSTLSKEKLIEAGVSALTIQACTVEGKPYQYILVSEPKAKK